MLYGYEFYRQLLTVVAQDHSIQTRKLCSFAIILTDCFRGGYYNDRRVTQCHKLHMATVFFLALHCIAFHDALISASITSSRCGMSPLLLTSLDYLGQMAYRKKRLSVIVSRG